jgi:hypothetical protein
MQAHTASRVRAASLRSKCLSFENTCSMGFRSGEYLGKKNSWTLLRTSPTYRISDSIGTDGSEMIRCGDSLDFLISMIG